MCKSRTNFDMCHSTGIGGVCLFVFLSFCLFVFLSFCLFVFLYVSFIDDFLYFFARSNDSGTSAFEARLLREKEALLPTGTRKTRSTVTTTAASVPPEKSERKKTDFPSHPLLFHSTSSHSPKNDSLFLKKKSILRTLIAIDLRLLRY